MWDFQENFNFYTKLSAIRVILVNMSRKSCLVLLKAKEVKNI